VTQSNLPPIFFNRKSISRNTTRPQVLKSASNICGRNAAEGRKQGQGKQANKIGTKMNNQMTSCGMKNWKIRHSRITTFTKTVKLPDTDYGLTNPQLRNHATITQPIALAECLSQGCETYGTRAKSGPLRGWIRPAGWFCKVKTSLFAWEVYPVMLR